MDRVELGDRLLVGLVVALGRQRPLADVDDEERRVEAALLIFGMFTCVSSRWV